MSSAPIGFKITKAVSSLFGYRAPNWSRTWHKDGEFLSAANGSYPNRNIVSERRFNLFNLVRSTEDIPGDLAECGVHRGPSSYMMLKAAPNKHLFGFDSFEGLSSPGPRDNVQWRSGDLAVGIAVARENLAEFGDRVTLLQGWIPSRFAEVADKIFSHVHIDADLYEPTKASAEFFWPRLSPGGMMVCDDYGSVRCPGARVAMDELAASVGKRVAHLTTGQGLLIK